MCPYTASLEIKLLISSHQYFHDAVQHLDLKAEDARTLFGWNYYPAPRSGTPQAQQLRLLPHADTDVITLLFQRPGANPSVPRQHLRTLIPSSPGILLWAVHLTKACRSPVRLAMHCSKVSPCMLVCAHENGRLRFAALPAVHAKPAAWLGSYKQMCPHGFTWQNNRAIVHLAKQPDNTVIVH